MRKPLKKDFGSEVTFAQEDWFTAGFLNIGAGKSTSIETADHDIVFYIDDGIAIFTINGITYEFGWGKTVLIRKGTRYTISSVGSPIRIIKVTQEILKDKDFSGGKKFQDSKNLENR